MPSSTKKQANLLSKEQSVDFPPTPPPTPAFVDAADDNDGAPPSKNVTVMNAGADAAAKDSTTLEGTANAANNPAAAAAQPPEVFIRDLCILPPRQKSTSSTPNNNGPSSLDASGAVPLPPLRPEEPVSSLRAALGEVKGYAHLTSYRLVLEHRPDGIEKSLAAKRRAGSAAAAAAAATAPSSSSSDGGAAMADSRHPSPPGGSKGGGSGGGKKSKKKKGKGGGGGGGGSPTPSTTATAANHRNQNRSVPPSDVVSPHTGKDAVVMVPAGVRSLETDPSDYTPLAVLTPAAGGGGGGGGGNGDDDDDGGEEVVLDDYGDLVPYVDHLLGYDKSSGKSHMAFRVVLERYDAAGVRDHVARLRTLLDGNAPSVVTLAEEEDQGGEGGGNKRSEEKAKDDEVRKEGDGEEEKKIGEDKKDATAIVEKAKGTKQDAAEGDKEKKLREATARKEQRAAMASNMPSFPLEHPVSVDGTDLTHYYYLACGEEDDLDAVLGRKERVSEAEAAAVTAAEDGGGGDGKENIVNGTKIGAGTTASGGGGGGSGSGSGSDGRSDSDTAARDTSPRLNDLDALCRVRCTVRFGGFHPPPPQRRVMGDLAYLEVTMPGQSEDSVVHVTAVPTGFYVNRTYRAQEGSAVPYVFDPTPADNACFSHELLDCLLLNSKSLRSAWACALSASKERAELSSYNASNDSPLQALYRVAVRSDFGGNGNDTPAPNHQQGIDSVILRPSWLVPLPRKSGNGGNSGPPPQTWTRGGMHEYNPTRAEEDLTSTFGLDIRGGAARDWNEELQSARELPRDALPERLERAKMVHKVLSDFGDAALAGVKAIMDGLVAPMNPNEPTRSHVYLHNNIFFSRAVDAGVDTFKICQGDRAARKSATRDAHCMGTLHRFDILGLHTLATVLVDYLGTRLVCQSIVPGILHGEKTHTLLYGAVEATSPLSWDEEMHGMLEDNLGKGLMIATRKVPTLPLSDERMKLVGKFRSVSVQVDDKDEGKKAEKTSPVTTLCGPIEAKGIRGSDQRTYILDLTRLTPRDANWVPKAEGGTGHWESVTTENGNADEGKNEANLSAAKAKKYIPESLADDEHTMAVFRPELVTALTHKKMSKYLGSKTEGNKENKEVSKPSDQEPEKVENEDQKSTAEVAELKDPASSIKPPKLEGSSKKISLEDEEHLKSLRLNVNVFLPNTKSLEGIDADAFKQVKEDEERVREAASYLWDDVLPSLTKEIRENSGHNVPVDGSALTEVLHQRGINCRYLGRLATLALAEEAKDRQAEEDLKSGKSKRVSRRMMPLCWLEMLECEMVARAAKHVLDSYFTEKGGAAAAQPGQTVASFLSALMSTGEESAAETELRVNKGDKAKAGVLDGNAMTPLSIGGTGGNGDASPSFSRSRAEVWEDIEREIGRRFRYVLTLYNTPQAGGKKDSKDNRALYTPLLRRVCQRNGLRIVARDYQLGGKCVCDGGDATYPIAPQDIMDVLPLVKHSASLTGAGFVPTSFESNGGSPSLYVLLPDAKATFEAAHVHWNARALPQALDLVQEAASLYQRVVDTPLHASVAKCLEMTAAILFHANEPELAAANAARSLAVAVQLGGFDCPDVLSGHSTLSHILISSNGVAAGIKHLRASLYLTELMAGPHHPELSTSYHKLGTMYHEIGSAINALRFYQEASSRKTSDRLVEGMISKSTAIVLAGIGQFKSALETEKRAFSVYSYTLGEDHDLTANSANTLKQFMKLAVEQGTRMVKEDQKRKEEQAANAIASQIEADEVAAEAAGKKKKKKKKKKN